MALGAFDYGAASADQHALRSRYGLPIEGPVALFFGSLRRDKGLDLALRALAAVPELTLLVSAHEPSRAEPPAEHFRALAVELGVATRVVWQVGWLPDEEVPNVFMASDFVVLPYRRDFSGQSAVLKVAQQYGLPVIGSDHGQLGVDLRSTPHCITVPAESPEDLARAMSAMLTRSSLDRAGEQGGAGGAASWDLLATDVRSTYRDLLSTSA